MRILTVSAHFPPNFVSGATIVTAKVSRELKKRGHQVTVFSGWAGTDRPAGSTWSEEIDGLPVQWVAITPWTVWKDPRNYDNPATTELFSDYLDRTPADVVHFHSLQSLGVGLVHAAADRGIPIVTTMHDFWWWCPRQFLCDRRYQPCCLVVDAGACPCEAGRPQLEYRNAVMRGALEKVDRIVAVSHISAQVLIANGADPERVVVIENGIPDSSKPSRPEDGSSSVVRFVYAGGPDRMKGPHVLAGAVHLLGQVGGWTLDCYGCEIWRNRLSSPSVRVHPAFAPAELDGVLASADVLVLPSVARESYSILAREALSRGLPVISSDCLGPQEVVRHHENGLIVSSGDPGSLATAMRELVEEPRLLSKLRSGCRQVELPSETTQAGRIEQTYLELLTGTPQSSAESRRPIRRVLFVVGIDGAPLRYRAQLPAEGLRSLGVHTDVLHYRHPDVPELEKRADAVVVYRVPATTQVVDLITRLRSSGTPVVFDVDDLIFVPELADRSSAVGSLTREESDLWFEGVRRYRVTMEQCDAFFGSTPELVRHAEEAGVPARLFPNGVGRLLAQESDRQLSRARHRGRLRLGYLSGTKTHQADWRMVEPAIARILDSNPATELWLVGLIEPSPRVAAYGERIVRLPLVPWWKLPGLLRDLDIHLAPLVLGEPFNECKSAIKWLEAALVATPTVASPTGPFREVIRDGENGFLADTEEEWIRAIQVLLDSSDERVRIGAEARRDALIGFAPAVQARRYLDLLEGVRPRALVTSTPDVHLPDEPARFVRLEPYGPPPRGSLGRIRAAAQIRVHQSESVNRGREVVAEAARTMREEGPGALLARTGRFLSRTASRRRPGS